LLAAAPLLIFTPYVYRFTPALLMLPCYAYLRASHTPLPLLPSFRLMPDTPDARRAKHDSAAMLPAIFFPFSRRR